MSSVQCASIKFLAISKLAAYVGLFSVSGAHEAINISNVIKDNLKIVFIFSVCIWCYIFINIRN